MSIHHLLTTILRCFRDCFLFCCEPLWILKENKYKYNLPKRYSSYLTSEGISFKRCSFLRQNTLQERKRNGQTTLKIQERVLGVVKVMDCSQAIHFRLHFPHQSSKFPSRQQTSQAVIWRSPKALRVCETTTGRQMVAISLLHTHVYFRNVIFRGEGEQDIFGWIHPWCSSLIFSSEWHSYPWDHL